MTLVFRQVDTIDTAVEFDAPFVGKCDLPGDRDFGLMPAPSGGLSLTLPMKVGFQTSFPAQAPTNRQEVVGDGTLEYFLAASLQ